MEISPLPGITGQVVLGKLDEAFVGLQNVQTQSGDWSSKYERYIRWANETAQKLSLILSSDDVDLLVKTPGYWALNTLAQFSGGNVSGLTDTEIANRLLAFGEIRRLLNLEFNKWRGFRGILALADTNFYLHSEQEFHELDWRTLLGARTYDLIHLVIPILVVKELDKSKRNKGNKVSDTNPQLVSKRAQLTLKKINELFYNPLHTITLIPPDANHGEMKISILYHELNRVTLPDADSEILDRALTLQSISGVPVKVVTKDVNMHFTARTLSLESVLL